MKVLVVGYGSMGRRRIRLLKRICQDCSFICVDNNTQRLKQIKEDGLDGYDNLEAGIKARPDVAFVCTSPGHHAEIILELIQAGIDVFTELNLTSDRYDDIIALAKSNNVKVFMSNTTLYNKQIVSIMDKVREENEKYTYIYHVGQYLPDWHPWENYKDFFIGKKETNGCREIMAIQLPWIIKLFGDVIDISVIKENNSKLDIDFPDTYIINLQHISGHSGVFICDVIARHAIKYLEIMGERTHIVWNGSPETLLSFDEKNKCMKKMPSYARTEHVDGYADIISENQYIDEIYAFLDWRAGGAKPRYTFEEDKYILDLIDEIEGIK